MRLVAAAAAGVFVYFGVGYLIGSAPRLEWRARPARDERRRQQWLIQAGLDLTPRQFWAASALAGINAFAVVYLITGIAVVALVLAAVVAALPRAYFARARAQRLAEVQQAWPDGLRDLIASISAGVSLPKAIEVLARDGPTSLRRAFARYPLLARTLGIVPTLEVIKEELADPTSDRVLEVLILAYQRGGSIVTEILRDLAEATTRDLWAMEEIRTLALEQKINARVVFALPWLVLVLLTAQQGAFREFYASPAGAIVVVVGGLLSLFGMWLVTRLGREPTEERVFGFSRLAGDR